MKVEVNPFEIIITPDMDESFIDIVETFITRKSGRSQPKNDNININYHNRIIEIKLNGNQDSCTCSCCSCCDCCNQ